MIAHGPRSFYQPGGALPLDSPAYVRRAADDHLFACLMRGEYCSILTSRQMGKSSLIARTSARLRAASVDTSVIDLSGMSDAIPEPEKWYFALVLKLGKALGRSPAELARLWSSSEWPTPSQRWTACIEHLLTPAVDEEALPLVVFLDEIDATRDMEFKDGFFAMIRSCYNRRPSEPVFQRLTFCLVGSARPTDLIGDPHLTPFNIGRRIELTDFSEEEAQALLPGMERGAIEGQALLRRVLHWTGGHPYLTHRLCMRLAESSGVHRPEDVDQLAETLFFSTGSREQDDNLAFVSHRVLTSCPSARDVARLLSIYDELLRGKPLPDHKSDPVLGVLHLAGLVRSEDGVLAVRNRIYRRVFDRAWVRENMPDAQLRMVRAAYWRAAFRWAGLAAVTSAIAAYAMVQRRAAIQNETIANRLAHAEHVILMQSMSALWDHADLAQMEANLRSTPRSERNFEWRYWLRQLNQSLYTLSDPEAGGGRVAAAAFAPDGSWLATSGKFPFIDIWDPHSGALIRRLPEPDCPYTLSLDLSPDGTELVSGGDREVARLWDTRTWRQLARLDMGTSRGEVTCVRFSADGRSVAAAALNGAGTRVFDAHSGALRITLDTGTAWAVAFQPNAPTLAVAGTYSRITLWRLDVSRKKPDATLPAFRLSGDFNSASIDCLVYSSDGRLLAAGSKDNSVRIWDVARRQIARVLNGSENGVSSIVVTPKGDRMVGVGLDRSIRVWSLRSGEQVETIPAHTRWINCVSISRTGLLATAADDGTAKVWRLDAFQDQTRVPNNLYSISKPVLVGGRFQMPSSDWSGRVGWLDPETNKWTPVPIPRAASQIFILVAASNGRDLEAIDRRGQVFRWSNGEPAQAVILFHLPADFNRELRSVAFSPDGDQALIGLGTGQVARVDFRTRSWQFVYADRSTQNAGVVWAPGKLPIWSAGPVSDRLLFVGDPSFQSAPKRLRISSSGSLFVSNDGSQILASCVTDDLDPDPTLIETSTLKARRLVGHATACRIADFSPDGSRIVTGGGDNTVRLWDAKEGINLQTWRVGFPPSVLFSPDGNQLFVWSGTSMRLLTAATPDEVNRWTTGWQEPG